MRSLAGANAVLLLVVGGLFAFFFFSSLYVQQILGYSPLEAGLAFLPVTAGIGIGAGIAQQLVKRIGVRTTAASACSSPRSACTCSRARRSTARYLSDVLPAVIPQSIGMGLFFVPITLIATTNVGNEDAGLASGLFNTAQQVGGALGLAVLSTLAADKSASVLGDLGPRAEPGRAGERAARRSTSSRALACSAGLGRWPGRRGRSRLSAASVESTARPSAPPTCWDVLNRPDARPASSRATFVVAISVSGTNVRPIPIDMQ